MGVFHEQQGIPPTEARILSLMLVADETALTFDQVREALSISKSATSTGLNMLLKTQKVVYTTRPGDRKRYFSSNILSWEEQASSNFSKMFEITSLLQEVLDQRTPKTKEFNEGLQKFIQFIWYLNEELPQLFEKWRNRQENKK